MQCRHHFRSHIYIPLILCIYTWILFALVSSYYECASVCVYLCERRFFYVDVVPVPITYNVIYVSQSTHFTFALLETRVFADIYIDCSSGGDDGSVYMGMWICWCATLWLYDQAYCNCTFKLIRKQQHEFDWFNKWKMKL